MGAVVAIDLPEHGEDEDLDPGLVAQLQGVSAVIEQLALRELVFIGHSMGTLPALLLHSPPREIVRSIASTAGDSTVEEEVSTARRN